MLKTPLILLVEELAEIMEVHEEVGDTAVREAMSEAIQNDFIVPKQGYVLPYDFSMFSDEGNKLVRKALARFLAHADVVVARERLRTAQERLDAFQDPIETEAGFSQEEFFGYADTA